MRRVCALLFLLAATTMATAAPPTVTAPEKVFGEVGDWVSVQVTTDGQGVKFVPLDAGLKLFPANKLKNANETLAFAARAGRYRVLVYTGGADGPSEPVIVTVVPRLSSSHAWGVRFG